MGFIRLRLELRALQAAIDELRDAIQNHSETIHAAQEAERKYETIKKPIPVLVSYDQQTKTEQNGQYGTQEAIAKWTKRAVIAAIIYAAIAAFQWYEMREANRSASRAIEAQTRPWVGIDGDLAIKDTKFIPTNQPTQMQVDFSFTLKNYGQSPATRIAYTFEIRPGSPAPKASFFKDICVGPDSQSRQTNWKITGSIFPQITAMHDAQVTGYAQFLYGCIAYQHGENIYHTIFVYQIITEKSMGGRAISPSEMRPILSPVKSFRSWYTDAE